jgi:hypothetical protein
MIKLKELNEKINSYINHLPLWKFFIYSIPFWFIVLFVLFSVMMNYFLINPNDPKILETFNTNSYVKMSIILSIIISILTTLIQISMKSNQKFWDKSEEFEKLLEKTKTKNEVELLNPFFDELNKLSDSEFHIHELRRLQAIKDTRYELLPKTI